MSYGLEVYKANGKLYLRADSRLLGIWAILTYASGLSSYTITIPPDVYASRKEWIVLPAGEDTWPYLGSATPTMWVSFRYNVSKSANVFTLTPVYIYGDSFYPSPVFLVAGV